MKKVPETRLRLIALAGCGSAAALLSAFAFQHLGGLAPCDLCITQRWAHVAVIGLAMSSIVVPRRPLLAAGAIAGLLSASAAGFHVGVEKSWWSGPSSCSGNGDLADLSGEELLSTILAAPVVSCGDVAWEMMGFSMAGWNGIVSLLIAAVWIAAFLVPDHSENSDTGAAP